MSFNLRRFVCLFLLAALLILALPVVSLAVQNTDAKDVRVLVERAIAPMKPIRLDIAIAGNYALSTAADAVVGGTALLKKGLSGWHIVQQTGGAYRDKDLVEFGLSSKIAHQLIVEVSHASAR